MRVYLVTKVTIIALTTFGKQFAFGLDCKKNVFQILFYGKLVSEGSQGPLPLISVRV